MRATWICCAATLCGCDFVWRLDDVKPVDAPPNTSCETNTHDEDGDNVFDDCDVCPGIADDQTDSDHDGVGDACDPSDSTPHMIALFVSFAEPSPIWNPLTGTWTPDGESIVYESTNLDSYGVTIRDGLLPEPPYVVEAHFSIDSLGAYGTLQIGIDADATGNAMTCGLIHRSGPIDVVHASNPSGAPAAELTIDPISTGGYLMKATYDRATSIRCSITADDNSTGGAVPTAVADPDMKTGFLALRSLRVGATVHYIAIYKAL